jgi:HEAT repeat protein
VKPLLLALAVALEVGFALLIGTGVVTAVALHVAAAGAVAEALTRRRSGDAQLATAWLCVLALPLFGVLAGLLLYFQLERTAKSRAGESWEARREEAARAALDDKRSQQQVGPDVLPIIDALESDDPRARSSAIEVLREERSPRAVRLLSRLRQHERYDVRLAAVESLARMSRHFLDEIAANRRLGRDGYARLAQLHLDYAGLGLESRAIADRHLQLAVAYGNRALHARFDSPTAVVVARALSILGAKEQAEAALRRLLTHDPEATDALVELAEIQLETRKHALLRATCARLATAGVDLGLA